MFDFTKRKNCDIQGGWTGGSRWWKASKMLKILTYAVLSRWRWRWRGGGGRGVTIPPKNDDVIYEQPLTFSFNAREIQPGNPQEIFRTLENFRSSGIRYIPPLDSVHIWSQWSRYTILIQIYSESDPGITAHCLHLIKWQIIFKWLFFPTPKKLCIS